MSTLVIFGLGFSARAYVAAFGARWGRIVATTRTPAVPESADFPAGEAEILTFDGIEPTAKVREAVAEADAVLVSIPPSQRGDPTLMCFRDTIATSAPIRSIVYLSTVGVYGDHDGGWVDEKTPPAPVSDRSRVRLDAENAWTDFGERAGIPVALLRLAGIYGAGRSTLDNLRDKTARRVIKPGQVFNRIHVDDVAQAIDAAFRLRVRGPVNVCDDEPSAPQDVVTFAAGLLDLEPPPEQSFETLRLSMSPMALSFYGENKRVRNERLKRELGVTLKYPTYREGLRALAQTATRPDDAATGAA